MGSKRAWSSLDWQVVLAMEEKVSSEVMAAKQRANSESVGESEVGQLAVSARMGPRMGSVSSSGSVSMTEATKQSAARTMGQGTPGPPLAVDVNSCSSVVGSSR